MAEVAWLAAARAVLRAVNATGAVADQERRVDVSYVANEVANG